MLSGLEMRQETVNVVDSYDLDKFIQKVYSLPEYEFVACEEVNNDSYHRFNVKARSIETEEYDNRKLRQFQEGVFQHHLTYALLEDLAHRGWIPEGTYIISVSW